MKQTKRLIYSLVLIVATMFSFGACQDKETEIGITLQDGTTIYYGIRDTAYDITAYTVFDDSLLTSGYSSAMIGRYTSPTYGPTEAIYYTQIGLPTEDGIQFGSNITIDSVILNYRLNGFYPPSSDTSNNYNFHFEIRQLSEQLLSDSAYYAFNHLDADGPVLFNETLSLQEKDTSLRFKLNANAAQLFTTAEDEAEFEAHVKGLRIKMLSDGDAGAVYLNLAATSTKLTVYYRYNSDTSTYYDFVAGYSIGHFNQFIHNYAGTPLSRFASNPQDTMRNSQNLYLTPTGGTNIYLRLDDFITRFHQKHPYAVIHYAELILPVASAAEADHPDMIYAYRTSSSGYRAPIADLLDQDLTAGFDGRYHADKDCYRLRISRHVQQLLRTQTDYGTLLVLNQRRTSALSTILNNTRALGCANPIRIEFIYTEIE